MQLIGLWGLSWPPVADSLLLVRLIYDTTPKQFGGHTDSAMSNALRVDIADGIAQVTFDLPGSKANTLGQAVLGEFEALFGQLSGRTDLRGLILQSGKPGMFIAGADLKELGSASAADPTFNRAMMKRGLAIIDAFEVLPFPTVSLIDGPCMGGGTEVALGFDGEQGAGIHRLAINQDRAGAAHGFTATVFCAGHFQFFA